MGQELAGSYEVARRVFEEVDDALKDNLSFKMWHGDAQALQLTENAQPALMACSMAVLRVLETEGFDFASLCCVAGHSLGEYTAHCFAGALSLPDTARLLRTRGLAMQHAVPVGEGAMAAILGLKLARVQDIANDAALDQVCSIANINTPLQVVVSGHRSAVERASALARERGARRVVALNVSAPFHCSLMKPAADKMRLALDAAEVANAKIPVVANAIAEPVQNAADIRRLLVDQVTESVLWTGSLARMQQMGVSQALEIGTGKVLSGTVRQTFRSIQCRPVETPEQVRRMIENA